MRWRKLINCPKEQLWRGTVFRLLKSRYPYEAPVDVMLVESNSADSGFALVVTTGYHAGCILREIPMSARSNGAIKALSRVWLIEH